MLNMVSEQTRNHHGLAHGGAFVHDLHDGCGVTVKQDPLALELIPPDS